LGFDSIQFDYFNAITGGHERQKLTFPFFPSLADINMNKDGGPGPTNPMLYDPIPEGAVQTTKIMQFVAATAGN
jgi:hypothetical protein